MNWSPVIMVEGLTLTRDTQVRSTGLAITSQPNASRLNQLSGEWYPALVVGSVQLGQSSWSPVEGSPTAQTLTFSLQSEIADGWDRKALRAFFCGDPDESAIVEYGEVIGATTTSFDVRLLTGADADTVLDEGSVIYIGAEAFRVASCTGNTVTIVDEIPASFVFPGGTSANDLDRSTGGVVGRLGHFGTRIATHTAPVAANAAPPYGDNRVFLTNPRLKGRRVWLFRAAVSNGALVEQLIGQFVIDSDEKVELSDDGTTISVSCVSVAGALDSWQFNVRSVQYQYEFVQFSGFDGIVAVGGRSALTSQSDSIWGNFALSVVQNGETIAVVAGGTNLITSLSFGGKLPDVTQVASAAEFAETANPSRRTSYNEALATYPFDVVRDGTGLDITPDQTTHPFYSTDRPDPDDPTSVLPGVLRHPLHMWLAHLSCLSSNLPLHWRIPLAADTVDVAGVLAFARGTLAAVTAWPGVVAGGDGEPLDAMAWLDEAYLLSLGLGRATDQYGRLTVRSIYAPALSTASLTQSNTQRGRPFSRPTRLAADTIVARMGAGVGKAPLYEVSSAEVYLPDEGTVQTTSIEIEAAGPIAADDPTTDLLTLAARPGAAIVRAYVTSLGAFVRKGVPMTALVVGDSTLNQLDTDNVQPMTPGSLVTVNLIGLLDIVTGWKTPQNTYNALVMRHQWDRQFTEQMVDLALYRNRQVRFGYALLITDVVNNGDGTFDLQFDDDETILPDSGSLIDYVAPDGKVYPNDAETAENTITTYSAPNAQLVDQYYAVKGTGALSISTGTGVWTSTTAPVAGDWLTLAQLGSNATAETVFAYFGRDTFGI
jgi:putative intracellular protease/amidase